MRMPAAAGRFYPADEDEVRADIENCFRLGPGMPGRRGAQRSTRAVLVPHAGYIFSGPCAAFAFKALTEEPRPEAYIVIGPDHYGNGCDVSMCTEEYWTPFGACEVAWDIAAELQAYVPDVPSAHSREHSVEVELPFLKYVDPEAEIVPIIMGDQSPAAARSLSSVLAPICREHDVVVIASSDLVHYVPREDAEVLDRGFLSCVASMDSASIYGNVVANRLTVCGYGPIAVAMDCSGATGCEILCQTDSSASGYDMDRVVGYGSARMFSRRMGAGDDPRNGFSRRSS